MIDRTACVGTTPTSPGFGSNPGSVVGAAVGEVDGVGTEMGVAPGVGGIAEADAACGDGDGRGRDDEEGGGITSWFDKGDAAPGVVGPKVLDRVPVHETISATRANTNAIRLISPS